MAEASRSDRPPAAPSAVFGKYQLLASLGQGGMADVYLAVVRGLVGFSKLVVIKRLRSSLAEEPEFLPMFLDEARLAARLNHPNVVQTNEVGEVSGEYFIAMEYLEGQPLNRILSRSMRRKTPIPQAIFLHMLCEALAGLQHAHELKDFDGTPLNVVHRDASPHNIFVTYEGITKLVDFGIAKAATRSYETRTGVLKGKLQYMAPEQARCEDVDRRADVFSLGAVLWELLAGQRLWAGLTDLQVLEKLVSVAPASPKSINPEVPEELERIAMKALARDVDERYPTAAAFREDLEAYMKDHARCSSREVAAFVSDLFQDKREQIRGIIERQLARAHTGADLVDINDPSTMTFSTDSLKLMSQSGPRGGTPTGSAGDMSESSGPHTGSTSSNRGTPSLGTPSGVAPQASFPGVGQGEGAPRSKTLWMVAALAAAAALALFVVRSGQHEPAPDAGANAPAAARDAPASLPGAIKTVVVRIEATPADARITIDDTPLPTNPFEGRFPADGISHRIGASSKGFRTERRMVTFDQDVRESFDLAVAEEPKADDTKPRDADPKTATPDRPRPPRPHVPPPAPPKPNPGSASTQPPPPPTTPKGPGQPTNRPLEKGDPWGN